MSTAYGVRGPSAPDGCIGYFGTRLNRSRLLAHLASYLSGAAAPEGRASARPYHCGVTVPRLV